jgi:hypothetical protein
MTRAREPNLPARMAATAEMGGTRDTWLRTSRSNSNGRVFYKASDASSITKASDSSWTNTVDLHIFPLVDWYDARVKVGSKNTGNGSFGTTTSQSSPGNPDGGNEFNIAAEARYYLEGAIEYLDAEGEYHVSLGDVVSGSRGWTLFYPPADVSEADLESAVLSISKNPIIDINADSNLYISFEHLVIEGGRRFLATVYNAYYIDFYKCTFINAGHDAVEVWSHHVTFRDCVFEGAGGSSVRMADDRDFDTDGRGFLLLESGSAVVDSLLSDFASTCRHYSEGE